MDTKKISFGFNKLSRKANLLLAQPIKPDNQIELIKCIEGQEIKLMLEKQEAAPLIIPMEVNQKTSTALASLMKRRAVLLGENEEVPEVNSTEKSIDTIEDDNLEKRAARELLAAATKSNVYDNNTGENLVLPVLKADELPLDGAKEPTMDDYESIPIQQYGFAMLRGMGWIEPKKKTVSPLSDEGPMMRPKGMGLGADKAIKIKPLLVQPDKNEILEIKKQAYVRILGGKYSDQYGQIEGFDDHAGRVIVKMAIGGFKEAFNEFLCQPVSKKEYGQYGKCINTAKYEEFKKFENEHGQIIMKRENKSDKSYETKLKDTNNYKYKDECISSKYFKKHELQNESKDGTKDNNKNYKKERNCDKYKDYNKYGNVGYNDYRPDRQLCDDNAEHEKINYGTTQDDSDTDDDDAANRRDQKKKSHDKNKHKAKKTKCKARHKKKYSSADSSDTESRSRRERRKTKKCKHSRSKTRSRSRGRR